MGTKKVLFLSRYASLRGAIEEIMTSLAAALPALGVEVEIYGRKLPAGRPGFADGAEKVRTPLPRPGRWGKGKSLRPMVRACEEGGVDLIHAHGTYRAGYAARLLSRATGLPYMVTSHGDVHVSSGRMGRRGFRKVCRAVLSDARAVTHLTAFMAEYTYDLCDVADKSTIIPNGIDYAWWDRPGPEATEDFVFALGRLMEYKGFGVLIEAMKILSERGAGLKLVIGGTGPFEAALRRQAAGLGLAVCDRVEGLSDRPAGSVCFPGFVAGEEKRALFQRCRLMAFPSQPGAPESFGVVQIEAMAAGKALVAADIPATRAILTHGRNAVLVPPDDAGQWAAAIGRVAGDEALRRDYGRANRIEAKHYDWPAIAARYAEVYRNVLGG